LPGLSLPGGPLSDLLGKSPFLPPTHTSSTDFSLQQQQQQQQQVSLALKVNYYLGYSLMHSIVQQLLVQQQQQQSLLTGHSHNQQMFSSFPFSRNGGPTIASSPSPSPTPAPSRLLSEVPSPFLYFFVDNQIITAALGLVRLSLLCRIPLWDLWTAD
jgi:hypothetical protein